MSTTPSQLRAAQRLQSRPADERRQKAHWQARTAQLAGDITVTQRSVKAPGQAVRYQSALTRYKTTPCGGTIASMPPLVFFVSPVHKFSVE